MGIMAGPTVAELAGTRPITRAERDATPDDGRRYELIDGVLIVSSAPLPVHQRAVVRLVVRLDPRRPPDVELFVAPFDVTLAVDTVVEPDLAVCRIDRISGRGYEGPPPLVIEVLSPSSRRIDLSLKKERYQAAGCSSYWVVDPAEPSIVAWDLVDGAYVEVARAAGSEPFVVQRPFAVRIVPAELVA